MSVTTLPAAAPQSFNLEAHQARLLDAIERNWADTQRVKEDGLRLIIEARDWGVPFREVGKRRRCTEGAIRAMLKRAGASK